MITLSLSARVTQDVVRGSSGLQKFSSKVVDSPGLIATMGGSRDEMSRDAKPEGSHRIKFIDSVHR
jgi:hypothetical protein